MSVRPIALSYAICVSKALCLACSLTASTVERHESQCFVHGNGFWTTTSREPRSAEYIEEHLGVDGSKVKELTTQLYYQHGTTLAGLVAEGHVIDYDDWHKKVHYGACRIAFHSACSSLALRARYLTENACAFRRRGRLQFYT